MPKFLTSNAYIKFQIAAVIATCIDYGIFALLTVVFHYYYLHAASISVLAGAITAFSLNRTWVFQAQHDNTLKQAINFIIVSIGNISLNLLLLFMLTETINIPYLLSKIIATVTIGLSYSYLANKYWVFIRKTGL